MTERLEGPVAVIGAGTMGRGIAYVALVAGAEVRLSDTDETALQAARLAIGADLDGGVERGKVDAETAAAARRRLVLEPEVTAACADARLVVEAVVEDIGVKHEVLSTAESVAAADAVLATNTSALPVTDIARVLDDPSRGVGMHFFNPVPRMRLCELIWAEQTSPETMDRADVAATAMGKTTVRVQDRPGFATSRLNALLGNEGLRMLEEGVASPEDIDTAAKLGLNHPMGPLEMADLVGLDVRLAVLEHLAATLGDRFTPTDTHRRLVQEGRLGRKSGRGVYRYADGRRADEPSDLPYA